jgi:hypothetical protein
MTIALLLILAAGAAPADRLPPQPAQVPSLGELRGSEQDAAIFTYRVDGHCRITRARKLQGPDGFEWRDADEHLEVFQEAVDFRFIDGMRRQIRERRVRLLGEMVREGELICRVLPSGDVAEAWIERRDRSAGRRRSPSREPLPVTDGEIEPLGTFSLDVIPDRSES